MRYLLIVLLFSNSIYAQLNFDDYFLPKTLRVDYSHSGSVLYEYVVLEKMVEEPYWGGSVTNLLDVFDYGHHRFFVYDSISGKLIYSKGFSSLFAEWLHTKEATRQCGNFFESILMPYPQKTIQVEFFSRNKNNEWESIQSFYVNPVNDIEKPINTHRYEAVKIKNNGNPSEKLDIVFIAEGYAENEMDAFILDCQKFAEALFSVEPFKKHQKKINIWAVKSPSEESGVTYPSKSVLRNTLLGATFDTFGAERYLMLTDHFTLRDVASNVPYDQIFVLVNTEEYGGGGIYNFFGIASAKHPFFDFLFWHEFAHTLGGLADEYVSDDDAFQSFYPLDIEPWEENITTLVAFENKWQDKLSKNVFIPTDEEIVKDNVVGVFEGAGYLENGVYRPMKNCIMRTAIMKKFCVVCSATIERKINFYAL